MTDQELVRRFLHEVAPVTVAQYGDDQGALDQDFNNWTDGLCKSGKITQEQYNNVCMPDLTDRQFIALLTGKEARL